MIGIRTFVYEELQLVARFESYWRDMHNTNPEDFPAITSALGRFSFAYNIPQLRLVFVGFTPFAATLRTSTAKTGETT